MNYICIIGRCEEFLEEYIQATGSGYKTYHPRHEQSSLCFLSSSVISILVLGWGLQDVFRGFWFLSSIRVCILQCVFFWVLIQCHLCIFLDDILSLKVGNFFFALITSVLDSSLLWYWQSYL